MMIPQAALAAVEAIPDVQHVPAGAGVITLISPEKTGKTYDTLRSLPGAWVIASPGAAEKVGKTGLGFSPTVIENLPTLPLVVTTLLSWQQAGKLAHCPAIVVDDASILLGDSMVVWTEERPGNGYHAYKQLAFWLKAYRRLARWLGIPFIQTFHARMPEDEKTAEGKLTGKRHRGAPYVESVRQTSVIPASSDVVLFGLKCPPGQWAPPEALAAAVDPWWPAAFMCNSMDPDWGITADRHDYLGPHRPYAPMHLGELLRAVGLTVPRWPGLEWQEQFVEAIVAEALAGVPFNDAAKRQVAALTGKVHATHIRWVVQDAAARLWHRRSQRDLNLFAVLDGTRAVAGGSAPPPAAAPAASPAANAAPPPAAPPPSGTATKPPGANPALTPGGQPAAEEKK